MASTLWIRKLAETLHGNLTNREDIITSDINTEWKRYCQLLVSKPKSDMKAQLKELTSNDMLKTLFPNLTKIGVICLLIPVTIHEISAYNNSQSPDIFRSILVFVRSK